MIFDKLKILDYNICNQKKYAQQTLFSKGFEESENMIA